MTIVGMRLSSSNSQAPSSDLNSRGCKNWEGMLKVGIWTYGLYMFIIKYRFGLSELVAGQKYVV